MTFKILDYETGEEVYHFLVHPANDHNTANLCKVPIFMEPAPHIKGESDSPSDSFTTPHQYPARS